MTWFYIDDSFQQHPKVLAIPRRERAAAVGLWTLAGTWCARHLTDGRVPADLPAEFGCTRRHATALVAAVPAPGRSGLWMVAEDGWAFHNWALWQKTREQVEAEREAAKERMRNLRAARSGDVRANTERTSPEVRNPRPVPSRPSVVKVSSRLSVADATPVDNGDDLDLDKIRQALRCDEAHASKVALEIVGRSSEVVRDPTAYVLRAIGAEPEKYKPTPTPARYVRRTRGETA
jgi:hypothetical protein